MDAVHPGKSIDPVEERDVLKMLEILKDQRVKHAVFDLLEKEYDDYIDSKQEEKPNGN